MCCRLPSFCIKECPNDLICFSSVWQRLQIEELPNSTLPSPAATGYSRTVKRNHCLRNQVLTGVQCRLAYIAHTPYLILACLPPTRGCDIELNPFGIPSALFSEDEGQRQGRLFNKSGFNKIKHLATTTRALNNPGTLT